MIVRATFKVTGKVQDVGLRAKTRHEARSLGLCGQAENLEDGSMKVVCEGPKAAIVELWRRIASQNGVSRARLGRIRYGKATGSFRGFRKVPEKDPARATSRKLDEGVRHLGRINLRLGRIDNGIRGLKSGINDVKSGINDVKTGINGVKSGINGVKSGINGVRSGIRAMDSHMGSHFRRLDRKYDRFGDTMAKVARDLHGIRGDLRKAVFGGKKAG